MLLPKVMQLLYLPGVTPPHTFAFAESSDPTIVVSENKSGESEAQKALDAAKTELQTARDALQSAIERRQIAETALAHLQKALDEMPQAKVGQNGEDQAVQDAQGLAELEAQDAMQGGETAQESGMSLHDLLLEEQEARTVTPAEVDQAKVELESATKAVEQERAAVDEAEEAVAKAREEVAKEAEEVARTARGTLPEGLIDAAEVHPNVTHVVSEEDLRDGISHISFDPEVTGAARRTYATSAGESFEFSGDVPEDLDAYLVGSRDAQARIGIQECPKRMELR